MSRYVWHGSWVMCTLCACMLYFKRYEGHHVYFESRCACNPADTEELKFELAEAHPK